MYIYTYMHTRYISGFLVPLIGGIGTFFKLVYIYICQLGDYIWYRSHLLREPETAIDLVVPFLVERPEIMAQTVPCWVDRGWNTTQFCGDYFINQYKEANIVLVVWGRNLYESLVAFFRGPGSLYWFQFRLWLPSREHIPLVSGIFESMIFHSQDAICEPTWRAINQPTKLGKRVMEVSNFRVCVANQPTTPWTTHPLSLIRVLKKGPSFW